MTIRYVPTAALVAGVALLASCQGQAPGQPGSPSSATTTGTAAGTPTLMAAKALAVGKAPHGTAEAQGFVYSSDSGSAQISVIDAKTDAVIKTIPVPDGTPGYIKSFHDGRHVLVVDKKRNSVLVIDPAKDHQIVQTIAVGSQPDKVRIDEDQVLVSLVGEANATMLTFDADRAKPPARKDLKVGVAAGDHRDVALAHGWVVAANNGDNNVTLLNLATGTSQAVSGGNGPGPVGIGTANEAAVAVIVGNAASNTVSFFELPGGGAATTISGVGLTPTDMVVDPVLGRAFITMSGSNEVAVVDYRTKTLVGKVPAGNRPVHILMAPIMPAAGKLSLLDDAVEALSHELWVGNDAGASVTVFDGETLRVKATIATDQGHHKMAFSGTKAYVSNLTANNVSVIDRTQIR